MGITNWKEISYLRHGTQNQGSAYAILMKHGIFEHLRPFDPVLVSTVCVDLDIAGSDLDIICRHRGVDAFRSEVLKRFGHYPGFTQWVRTSDDDAVVASFFADHFQVELYGSKVPVERQFAYRHLSVMERCLKTGGQGLREKVRALKRTGLKTEPSFARLLGLPGDPFLAFLGLESLSDRQLEALVRGAGF